MIRTCIICNRDFDTRARSASAKTCSAECSQKRKRRKQRTPERRERRNARQRAYRKKPGRLRRCAELQRKYDKAAKRRGLALEAEIEQNTREMQAKLAAKGIVKIT